MALEALLVNPLFWKYVDLAVMGAVHKAFQNADGMTDEELTAAIAELEAKAAEHDAWIDKLLAE